MVLQREQGEEKEAGCADVSADETVPAVSALTRMTSQCADTFSCSLNVVRMARIKQPRTIKNLQTHKGKRSVTVTHTCRTHKQAQL